MDYRIFNMHTDVSACDCAQGCTDTVRESVLKVDSWRKIPYCTRELKLHWQHAGLMLYHLYQLSYISTPPPPAPTNTQRNTYTRTHTLSLSLSYTHTHTHTHTHTYTDDVLTHLPCTVHATWMRGWGRLSCLCRFYVLTAKQFGQHERHSCLQIWANGDAHSSSISGMCSELSKLFLSCPLFFFLWHFPFCLIFCSICLIIFSYIFLFFLVVKIDYYCVFDQWRCKRFLCI